MNWLRSITASLALLSVFHTSSSAGEQEIARFRREYPAAARLLAEQYSRLKGTCTVTRTLPHGSNVIDRCSFACDGGSRKVEISRYDKADAPLVGEFVHCLGDASSFQLMRLPGKDYRIEGLGGDRNSVAAFDFLFGRYLSAPFLGFEYSLLKLMSFPKFRITSANYVEHKGRSLMQVECEMGDPATADKRQLLLDPDSGWVIVRAEVRAGMFPGSADICDVEYDSRESGPPLPKVVKFGAAGMETATCIFEHIRVEGTPESQFRLSAYGLADLSSAVPRRPRSYFGYWAGGVAIAGLLLAILIGALARRGSVVQA